MNIETTYFEIDRLKIEWGKTLNEVRPMLENIEQFESYGGWPNIRYRCSSIFGLESTECEIRAPFEDRPVLQVHYELAPIKTGFFEKRHSPFLEQLEKVLGKPAKTEDLYDQPYLKKEYLSGTVVYSAKWLLGDIRISLSVYGGIRYHESGLSAAAIFIDWIDEVKISRPFRESAKVFENRLTELIVDDIKIKKFKLQSTQRPFRVVDYDIRNHCNQEKDSDVRACQMSLYRRALYQTPPLVSSELGVDEIGYYKVANLDKIFVSNKWDTIFLEIDQKNEITFWDILPARGPGRKELDLKELKIEDAKSSLTLLDLLAQIEEDTGQEVERIEAYDD